MTDFLLEPQRILTTAIEQWQPVALIALFSGGYDSMITTHVLHQLDRHSLPIQVWAIDTQLAADGWHEYVQSVSDRFGWNFRIYDNKKGFGQYLEWVKRFGSPYSRSGHVRAFHRLKERGFDAIHMLNKRDIHDRTLFVTGRRRDESRERATIPEIEAFDNNNKVFCSPLVSWPNEQCDWYRIEHGLPDNPFYNTVRGSGDCQCNWGRFITLRMLQKHSPELAAGNVAEIDRLSRELHGYGWDGTGAGQIEMLEDFDGEAELTSPFLCEGCSRRKVRAPAQTIEARVLQDGFF